MAKYLGSWKILKTGFFSQVTDKKLLWLLLSYHLFNISTFHSLNFILYNATWKILFIILT